MSVMKSSRVGNWSACSILAMMCLQTAVMTQVVTDPLSSRVTLVSKKTSVHRILGILSQQTKVPIGFEEAGGSNQTGSKLIDVEIRRGVLREALDAIVQADDRYYWTISHDVINVLPRNKDLSISTIRMRTFEVSNTRIGDVGFAITASSEVKARLDVFGLKDTRLQEKGHEPQLESRISFVQVNTTVGGILNDLLRKRKISYWAIVRYGNHNEYIAILLAGA